MTVSRRFLIAVSLAVCAPIAQAQIRVSPIVVPTGAAPIAVSINAPSAVSPSAVPLSAPALIPSLTASPIPAAAPALAAPALSPLSRLSAAMSAEHPAAAPSTLLNSFWDGFPSVPSDDSVETFRAGEDSESSAPFLVLRDREHSAALERAIQLARGTVSGRRAFDAAEKALAGEGRTLPVVVKDLGRNWGEYDYLDGRLRLHERLFQKGREAELAGTLAHELLHVAQHAAGLPSNALELEIEAHLQDMALMEELGLTPPPHTFSSQLAEALKKGPKAFIELIQMAVPGSPFLGESSFADIVDQLEQDLDSVQERKGPHAEKLAAVIAEDLRSLKSKKGRAAYKAFSARVLAELKRRAS